MASSNRSRLSVVSDAGHEAAARPEPHSDGARTAVIGSRKERAKGTLEDLYRSYRAPLVAWLRRRYGSGPPNPEDIAQTAFIKLLASDGLGRADHIRSYLYAIAVNTARDEIQWISRTDRFIERQLRESGRDLEEITPERIYSGKLDVDRLAELMGQLTGKQREIVRRSRILGQTYAQISEEMGWSMADISRQLAAALTFLKSRLEASQSDPARPAAGWPVSPRT
jgi:RNA polymerase sigma-70 factor (ECF subfamily)